MTKTAEQAYKELRESVIKPLVFYLPYDVLPIEVKASINETPILKQAFNTIVSISKDFEIHVNEITITDLDHINKGDHLDNNIMSLIELKETHSPQLFKFIYDKYFQLALGLEYATDWMHTNFDNYFSAKKQKGQKALFQFQANAFNSHITNLKSQFNFNLQFIQPNPNLATFLKSELSDVKFNVATEKKTIPSVKKKRPDPITAEKAKAFLLKTVFNVKIY